MKQSILKSAITTALGITVLTTSSLASAGVMSMNWTGYFIFLDTSGNTLANNSLSYKGNQVVTPISGTMQFDDVSGAGTATVAPFDFLASSNGPGADGW